MISPKIIPAVVLAATISCASGRAANVGSPPRAMTIASPAFTQVTLERRPCFGTCPVFTVMVAGDGAVSFAGTAHVDSMRGTARLGAAQITELARVFEDRGFHGLDDRYVRGSPGCGAYAADAPTVITSIRTAARSKTVEHDLGCSEAPRALSELERRIEEIVGVARWIGRR